MSRSYPYTLRPGDNVVHTGKPYVVQKTLPSDVVSIRSQDDGILKDVAGDELFLYSPKTKKYEPVYRSVDPIFHSVRTIDKKRTHPDDQIYSIFKRTRRVKDKPSDAAAKTGGRQTKKSVLLDNPAYHSRKQKQNMQFFQDVKTYLNRKSLYNIRVLALDDKDKEKKKLNTLTTFKKYGGRAANFYSCNTKSDVCHLSYDWGAVIIPRLLGDFLKNPKIPIQPFNAIYLDYYCKWEKASSDIELLFENHEKYFDKKGVILHLTLSKMYDEKSEYQQNMEAMLGMIKELGATYGYEIEKIRSYISKTMYKLGLFIHRVD